MLFYTPPIPSGHITKASCYYNTSHYYFSLYYFSYYRLTIDQDKLQYPDWIEDTVVVLVSKDDKRFELKFGIVLCSDTIKALTGFPERVKEREEVSPSVHCLVERTRAIFVIVVVVVETRRRANSSLTS